MLRSSFFFEFWCTVVQLYNEEFQYSAHFSMHSSVMLIFALYCYWLKGQIVEHLNSIAPLYNSAPECLKKIKSILMLTQSN